MTATSKFRTLCVVLLTGFAALVGLALPASAAVEGLRCGDLEAGARGPVLLIHGTGTTAEESWSWGYQPALTRAGFGVCVIDLPQRARQDLQVSADNVAAAIRDIYDRTGRKVSVIGHSQGGLHPAWTTRFFPDVAAKVEDSIGLATPYSGNRLSDLECPDDATSCPATSWQFKTNSNYIRALLRDPLPAGPSYTSIGTYTDELVQDAPRATRLPGAKNIMVQDVCPARLVDHYLMVADGAVYAMALDALTHAGPADPRRIPLTACANVLVPGVDLVKLAQVLPGLLAAQLGSGTPVPAEPPLRCYARENPQAC